MRRFPAVATGLALLLWHGAVRAPAMDHAHTLFDGVLKAHVRSGNVDYAALKADPAALDRYLDEVAAVSEPEFRRWTTEQQLSLLVNLYNAATLKLIIDHYPVRSIKDIGSLLRGPWDQPVVRWLGGTITLNHLEHQIIRPGYPATPETHFALVCAAKGCPPLREEAYVPERLASQLADQRRTFLADTAKNSMDAGRQRLNLSPIFKWYGDDFARQAGSVQAYLKATWPDVEDSWEIRYTDYDWSLNEP